jgi:hypothetical protein
MDGKVDVSEFVSKLIDEIQGFLVTVFFVLFHR